MSGGSSIVRVGPICMSMSQVWFAESWMVPDIMVRTSRFVLSYYIPFWAWLCRGKLDLQLCILALLVVRYSRWLSDVFWRLRVRPLLFQWNVGFLVGILWQQGLWYLTVQLVLGKVVTVCQRQAHLVWTRWSHFWNCWWKLPPAQGVQPNPFVSYSYNGVRLRWLFCSTILRIRLSLGGMLLTSEGGYSSVCVVRPRICSWRVCHGH